MAEQYPSDVTLNALSGGSDSEQEVPYLTIAESPYYTSFYKMLYRLLDVARRAGDLRVYKDGTNTFGVRAGQFMDGDTAIDYEGATEQALTDDATNYIYITPDESGLTVNTTGFPVPSAGPHVPLATIATGTASAGGVSGYYGLEDITDYRGRSILQLLEAGSLKVRNNTGFAMSVGELVYLSGYSPDGSGPEAAHAGVSYPEKVASHVVLEDIANSATGRVGKYAVLTQDTSGLAIGDLVYGSAIAAGGWSATAPTNAGQYVQVVGIVKTVGETGQIVFLPGLRIIWKQGTEFLQDKAVIASKLASTLQDAISDLNVTFGAEEADKIVVTAQARDAAGNDLAELMAVRVWISETDFGAPSATGNTVSIDTGTILQTILANADYELITDPTGKVDVGITISGAASRYVMAEIDGRVYSSGEITWEA